MARRRFDPTGDRELFDQAIGSLERRLGRDWLSSDSPNPLSALWKRSDWLASAELFSVGHSLWALEPIATTAWVNDAVSRLKGSGGDCRGAALELLASAAFLVADQTVQLPKPRNPGFDLTVTTQAGVTVDVSLRNHGTSARAAEFSNEGQLLERHFGALLRSRSAQLTVVRTGPFPGSDDWSSLRQSVARLVEVGGDVAVEEGKWMIAVGALRVDGRLSVSLPSYVVRVLANDESYERLRLERQLDKASADMTRKGRSEASDRLNAVYLRLPPDASLEDARKWTSDYLSGETPSGLSLAVLFQPSVYEGRLALQLSAVGRPTLSNLALQMELPLGVPLFLQRVWELADGRVFDIGGCYSYQSGHVYYEYELADEGAHHMSSNCGVEQHHVLLAQSERAILSGRAFAHDERLAVL